MTLIPGAFDAVIACDNAIPHLLDDADVQQALEQMRGRLRAGGVLLITLRDLDRALVGRPAIAPPTIVAGPPRKVVVRLHDWDPDRAPFYTVRFLILSEVGDAWSLAEHTTRYRAITRDQLTGAARSAGFTNIVWRQAGEVTGISQQILTALRAA